MYCLARDTTLSVLHASSCAWHALPMCAGPVPHPLQDEIASALGQSLTSEDTDAINEEFKQLEAATFDEELLDMPKAPAVPVRDLDI